MRLLDEEGLKQKGIPWSRQHRQRKINAGEFPAPVKIGANTNAWVEDEIDTWLKARIAERDSKAKPTRCSKTTTHPGEVA